jgi:predicted adenine nucleotide alpha hydrolase (AANH) superfamily ATPase
MAMKKKILLHACCAPCTAGVCEQLKSEFDVTLFWYNPNIFPKAEHDRRLSELINFCDKENIKIIVGEYDWDEEHNYWLELIKGLEKEPERGKRCQICYQMRLEATAALAAQANDHHDGEFNYFAAELSISPHKNSKTINEIGDKISKKLTTSHPREGGDLLRYYSADFKKDDGAKLASEISSKNNLYRQDYCGCEFSKIKK